MVNLISSNAMMEIILMEMAVPLLAQYKINITVSMVLR